MKIAILMAQADTSNLATRFPNDGESFITLLRRERPDWQYSNHMVVRGNFPTDITQYDGFLITGSTASANDAAPWILRLQEMVRAIEHAKTPLFGACFGHQLIAKALGGTVIKNPTGWRFGVADSGISESLAWMRPAAASLPLFAAHCEQVSVLPKAAVTFATSKNTANAGFIKGRHIATTQYHPEISSEFFTALVAELQGKLPPDAIEQAKSEKNNETRGDLMAKWIVQFFEQGN